MQALINGNLVVNISDTEYPPFDGLIWVPCPDDCQPGWLYENNQFIPPIVPQPTNEQLLDNFTMSVNGFISITVEARGYSSISECASYFQSSVALWAQDAAIFIPWRDQVWELTFAAIEPFESGTGDLPDINVFIASLPPIVWPGA